MERGFAASEIVSMIDDAQGREAKAKRWRLMGRKVAVKGDGQVFVAEDAVLDGFGVLRRVDANTLTNPPTGCFLT